MSESAPFLNLEELYIALSLTKLATAIHIGEDATIQFANEAMLRIWGKDKSIIGKTLADALPEIEGQPFGAMMARVFREGITISGTDTPANLEVDGQLQTYYFDFEYRAVKDETGRVLCILHTSTDVTERFLNQKEKEIAAQTLAALLREQSLNEELASSNEELNAINEELSASREELTAINNNLEARVEERVKAFAESEERFRTMAEGTDILIAVSNENGKPFYFNKAWSNLTGRSNAQLIERGWVDLLHEDDRGEYLQIHRTALLKKASYTDEFRVLDSNGQYRWLLKKGTPRFLSDGTFTGYISSCVDISQRKLDEHKLQEVNEELATANEELSAVNEELTATNEELEVSHSELLLSEARFRNLILQAPIGICVIRAQDLLVLDVNDSYLELVGKKREELENRIIWDAVPEAAEAYAPIMQGVITTGIAFKTKETEIKLIRNGISEQLFVDFVYEPVKNSAGIVTAVMVLGIDVTDKTKAKQSIADAEERVRLAVDGAEIGTYEYHYELDQLTTSDRFNQIFGFDKPMSRLEVISMYHLADRHLSDEAHELAMQTGKIAYETRFIAADQSIHWVRIQGNVYFNATGKRVKLLGTVLDITEYKRLQQQKDDFISIASHELKTPLTSLKASLQLLERMKTNPSPLLPKLIGQSAKSMRKISELVEDLLNVSRMNEGHISLNKQRFELGKMLEECSAQIRQDEQHELILEGDLTLEVEADEHRIEQVVVNFVNNAVKYAPNSKEIYIISEKQADKIKVSVKDNGPGIAPDKLPHLFDRYFRADETGAQVSGLGLGLYISADIIARHGGQIGVDSELGKGSTFWFTLPV
jgi:PAS domain S-box-containing protein